MEHIRNPLDLMADLDTPGLQESERACFPPGHPVSWGILVDGTSLAGTDYPLPGAAGMPTDQRGIEGGPA